MAKSRSAIPTLASTSMNPSTIVASQATTLRSDAPTNYSTKVTGTALGTTLQTQDVSRVDSNEINPHDELRALLKDGAFESEVIKSHISDENEFENFLGLDFGHARDAVSDLEALAISTVFEDLEQGSELIGRLFPGGPSKQSEFISYDEKFKKEVTEKEMEYLPVIRPMQNPFDLVESELGSPEELEASKLQKDRKLLCHIVHQAKREIEDNKTFKILKANIECMQEWKQAAISLIDRHQESKTNLLDLCQKMVDYANEMYSAEQDRKEIINFLKDKLHVSSQKGKQDQRYARAYYEARNDQNLDFLNHDLHMAELHMASLEVELARDKFCHRNVEDYFELVIWETQKKIDHWSTKFDMDLETIDKQVRDKQDSIRNNQNQIEALNRMIEERMVELGPWEDQQRRDRELRGENLRLFYSARKIQRWWREYMVKHKLYKKKKGKKGKGACNDPGGDVVEEVKSGSQSARGRSNLSATPV